jgi:hypothetical protein
VRFEIVLVLGAAFLTLTGAEAMYADMGHFGPLPIRLGWVLYEIWRLFRQEGIQIPYPKRDLYVRSDLRT